MKKLTEIQLGKKVGKTKYPQKTSLNLLIQEKDAMANPKVQIFIFVIFIILLLAFTKFMVVDKITAAYEAQSEYESMQKQITELKAANKEFDKVREEYSHYGNGYLNAEEMAEADRNEMLNLIDSMVLGDADIQSIEISGNVAMITINDINLKTVSSIVASLEDSEPVSYVSVATAGTDSESGSNVTATFTVEFKSAGGEQK